MELNSMKLVNMKVSDLKAIADAVFNHTEKEIPSAIELYKLILSGNPSHTFESFKEFLTCLS